MKFSGKLFHPASAMLIGVSLGLTGCATIKPSYVDASGDKIKSVVVFSSFKNIVTSEPSDQDLSEALAKNVCKYAKTLDVSCEASLNRMPPASGTDSNTKASHLIVLDAELYRQLIRGEWFWNDCYTQSKDRKCIGGLDKSSDLPALMRMTVDVIEVQSGKSIYKVGKPQTFESSDVNKWAASDTPASALFQGLNKAGLF